MCQDTLQRTLSLHIFEPIVIDSYYMKTICTTLEHLANLLMIESEIHPIRTTHKVSQMSKDHLLPISINTFKHSLYNSDVEI